MSGDYKVLVVVDLQNCFIQGGSLGSRNIKDLKKFIELVKDIDEKISQSNYDLVVFSKDTHPLNHSSLSDNTTPQNGVFTYHCRDSKNNCIKDTKNKTTYMSSAAKDTIRNILCNKKDSTIKEHFYDKKEVYLGKTGNDYNFYNPYHERAFKRALTNDASEFSELIKGIKNEMNDNDYDINIERIKTLVKLITDYIDNPDLDDDSKKYLNDLIGLLKGDKYKNLKVKGLDLNYLFYNTRLKDIIYALNTNSDSEIGITHEEHINEPDYNDRAYNVDNLAYQTNDANTKFITIAKGQYCDYESYSAFNYHTKIEREEKSIIFDLFGKYDSSLNILKKLPADKRYSTGLFEYILKDFKDQKDKGSGKTNINIDVCGLVTNICVINTVHQGIAMWEKVYKGENMDISCKFNLLEYLSIPLSIDIPGYLYLNYNYTEQINKEEDLGKLFFQVSNLKTLFITKFEEDVLNTNHNIRDGITYTVDFNIDLQVKLTKYIEQINQNIINSTQLNFTHINKEQIGGKKLKAAPKRAPKAVPKKAPKAAPKKAPKRAPKKAPKKAPKTAPKRAPKN